MLVTSLVMTRVFALISMSVLMEPMIARSFQLATILMVVSNAIVSKVSRNLQMVTIDARISMNALVTMF